MATDGAFDCNFRNYLMVGAEFFFLFNINFVLSYKLYCGSSDLAEFALHKILPSVKKKKRKRATYVSIWVLCILFFLFYTVHSTILNYQDKYDSLFSLNFYCLNVCTLLIFVQIVLFYLSFNRIRKVRHACASEKNSQQLLLAQGVSGIIVVVLLLFNSSQIMFTFT